MRRLFVSRFLLPLVKGGPLHAGRPLDLGAVAGLWAVWSRAAVDQADTLRSLELLPPTELHAAAELGFLRTRSARGWLLDAAAPSLDEESLRLGAAVHDMLLLSHPALAGDNADETCQRIADAALALATVGPPRTALIAVHRHSLLGRISEIVQPERVVSHWLGRHRYVGRTPPARVLAWPRLRRVQLDETRRLWLRDVGVSPLARPAWHALFSANPLGEALDPLRLDPPLSFARVLPLLRFAPLARQVAGRALEVGVAAAGASFAEALLRFAALRESATGAQATPADVACGLAFLSHLVWLAVICDPNGDDVTDPTTDPAGLADLLVAAAMVDTRLVFPADVSQTSDAGLRLTRVLARWQQQTQQRSQARHQAALALARHAALHLRT